MKTGKLKLIPVLKGCQSYVSNLSQLTRMAPTTLVGPPELKLQSPPAPAPVPKLQLILSPASSPGAAKTPTSYGNPCLDFYYRMQPPWITSKPIYNRDLKLLLPLAWSHNPLTTLKLIYNLLDCDYYLSTGKSDPELFYAAAFWLHENHPKTLARNLVPIVGLGNYGNVLEILCGILEGQDADSKRRRLRRENDYRTDHENYAQKKVGSESFMSCITGRGQQGEGPSKSKKKIAMANKALDLYKRDPDYQLLHERVSDLYADCLKSDIQNLNKYEQQKKDDANDPEHKLELELTRAAWWCPSVDSFFDRATLLTEAIARKVFPREECKKGDCVEEEEEADFASRVQERLDEVLESLRGYMQKHYNSVSRSSVIKTYFNKVQAGESEIEAGAMLPHEIIRYVNDCKFRELAEPQWKAMMEEIYLKQGKFKNCLAVCDVSGRMSGHPMNVSLALGLLVSEMTEEPWKGKVFTFSRNPQLHFIEGDDLKSKCAFMRRMDNQDWDGDTDFLKVFDLILDVAVKGNLKPEQMIKKLFVFTSNQDFDDASARKWKTDYEAIQRKFKEKGYENVVPRIVFWNLNDCLCIPEAQPTKQGVASLIDSNKKLVKCFYDNGGEVGPDQIMELAISGEYYDSLAVVD